MRPAGRLLFALALAVGVGSAAGAPYVPPDPAQVLERLPPGAGGVELARLRAAALALPEALEPALALARRLVEIGRTQADPRYLGYAQSALARWWDAPEPPVPVRVLRAVVRQGRHDFPGALRDLDAVLAEQPGNAQAWLTKAMIHLVRAEYPEAVRACGGLLRGADEVVIQGCLCAVAGVQGKAGTAYSTLLAAQGRSPGVSSAERAWVEGLLAELAARTGQGEAARRHFAAALAAAPDDAYLLAAYADWLLDEGRPDEVLTLLAGSTRADGLLLRLALAASARSRPEAPGWTRELGERLAMLGARGEKGHLREAARYALELAGDREQGLALALENWSRQREPADARLVLLGAAALARPEAAREVLDWMARSGIEDPGLARLAAECRKRAP